MFHKALWSYNWKQSKWAVLLLLLVNLYYLPYDLYGRAQQQLRFLKDYGPRDEYYYDYYFTPGDHLFQQMAFVVILACILLGWDRTMRRMDTVMALPFQRRHIFWSKWLFGISAIAGVLIVAWISMWLVMETTIHADYQSFRLYHLYFLYYFAALSGAFTISMLAGTITGNIAAQGGLSALLIMLPDLLFSILSSWGRKNWHGEKQALYAMLDRLQEYTDAALVHAGLLKFSIAYNFNPGRYMDDKPLPPVEIQIPSAWLLLAPIVYCIILPWLSARLYESAQNEYNGSLLLFPKLRPVLLVLFTICCSILGGSLTGGNEYSSLLSYYVGFFAAGATGWLLLSRMLHWNLVRSAKH